MIAYLRGTPRHVGHDSLILDVNGVGYLVKITAEVSAKLSAERKEQDQLELLVHTDVRETDIELFGFLRKIEREVFPDAQACQGHWFESRCFNRISA